MSSSDDDDAPKRQPHAPVHDELSPENLPCLFWDHMPENPEEHPDWQAMQALAEESSPEERAANFKDQGNKKLQMGLKASNKLLLREAIAFYGKGLALQCGDAAVNAALLNNRAHVHSLLGNWRSALQDAQAALTLEPSSVKATFRGARAAVRLKEWEVAGQLVEAGLKLDPGAKELLSIQQDLSKQRQTAQAAAAAEQAQREIGLQPAKRLAAALVQRGHRVGPPQVSVGQRKPYLDEEGAVHWPVLFMYPEVLQQDVVEDMHEDDILADHLDVMFGEGAPPLEWDAHHEYTRPRVQLYVLLNGGSALTQQQLAASLAGAWPEGGFEDKGPQRYGSGAAAWAVVDEGASLRQVLQMAGYVVPGVPLLWVLAEGSEYKARFLAAAAR